MTNYQELLKTKEYEFLWTDPHLGKNILFLCLGGSHSYGTNIETSDVDIRGVALNSEKDLLGITHFEQREDKATDTVIYSLNKFIELVSNCNPNVIEMLFCRPDHYIYMTPLGELILKNRHLFLTNRAYYTFSGYARAQLNRLENALSRDEHAMTPQEIEEHIARSVENCYQNCVEKLHFNRDQMSLHVGKDNEGNPELQVNVNLKDFPLRDFRIILSETTNVVADYKNCEVGNRNHKKDDLHLNKHMMHLIRLFLMGNEILKDGDLHTYREKEHDLLMDIRNGKYRTENGGISEDFYNLLNSLTEQMEELKATTKLPRSVDRDKVYDLIVKPIYKQTLFKD